MADAIGFYLSSLADELEIELGPDRTRAILAETEAHLVERMHALIELGVEPGSAAHDAVKVFGEPKHLAIALRHANQPDQSHVEHRIKVAAWLIVGIVVFATGIMVKNEIVYLAEIGAFLALVLWIGLLSSRLRSAKPLLFVKPILCGTALVWAFMTLFWMNLWMVGGMGYMPVWTRASFEATIKTRLPQLERQAAIARSVESAFGRIKDKRAALQSVGLLESADYARCLVNKNPYDYESGFVWTTVPIDDAANAWQEVESEMDSLDGYWSSDLLAFKAWDRISPLQRLGSETSVVGFELGLLTVSLWSANMIGVFIGTLRRRQRRRAIARRKGDYA